MLPKFNELFGKEICDLLSRKQFINAGLKYGYAIMRTDGTDYCSYGLNPLIGIFP